MTEPELSKFQQVIAQRKAAKEARESQTAAPNFPDGLIPEAQFERSEESSEIDRILAGVTVTEAYNRWCGKMKPTIRPGQTESIMISCPIPGHKDTHPSAWMNTIKNAWHCEACNRGGDVFDIAAFHFNYAAPDYKTNGKFPELRRMMVKDLGYVVERATRPGVNDTVYMPVVHEVILASTPAPVVHVEPEPVAHGTLSIVPDISPVVDFDLSDLFVAPTFDWHEVVTPGTFLDAYMGVTIQDDAAEEYHFWNGLLAISLAAGRDKKLSDGRPVYGNLMMCIIGRSGDRKSRSIEHLTNLLEKALPYDSSIHSGVDVMQGVASGEKLISMFDGTQRDMAGKPIGNASKTGLIEYGELSDLTSRAMRASSTLKPTLHHFADTKVIVATASQANNKIVATNPYACMITTTQPDSLKSLLEENDTKSGFLNRFVFVTGKAKKHIPVGGVVVDISPAVDPLQKIYGQVDRTITWSRAAQTLFETHFYENLEPAQQSDEMLARIDLLTKKLILIFCINENLNEVTIEVVQKAIYLFDYLVSVYRLTGEKVLGKHENAEIYEEIMKHIQNLTPKSKYGPSKKDVKDRIKRKGWDPQIVERMFEIITKDENVSVNQGDANKPGRKTEHFQFVGTVAS